MSTFGRRFDDGEIVGMQKLFLPSDDGESFQILTQYDMEPLAEVNHDERKEKDKHTRWGEGQRVASIPLSVYYDLVRKGIADDPNSRDFKKWLNDRDNQIFRTREGRV